MPIIIPLPIALVLAGAEFWPVTLGIAVTLVGIGFVLPWQWTRIMCFVIAGALAIDCLLALGLPPG